MPGHSAGADVGLKGMLDYIGRDNVHPDDFIIGNDPFILALGHVPDWTFVRPIFYEGELIFYHLFRFFSELVEEGLVNFQCKVP